MKLVRRVVSKILHIFYEHRARNLSERGKVLMFHSVGGETDEFNITIEQFEHLLKSLKEKNVARLEEWEEQKDFVCLTFDDVPVSFYTSAYPLLKKYELPFTIFVSCSLLDTDGFITTEMLKEMANCELCTIGSHGWKHDFFYKFSEQDARRDLESSKKRLESLICKEVILFAFPYGSYYACGLMHKHIVLEYYKYGFGTIKSAITDKTIFKKYYLPRINITTHNYNNI